MEATAWIAPKRTPDDLPPLTIEIKVFALRERILFANWFFSTLWDLPKATINDPKTHKVYHPSGDLPPEAGILEGHLFEEHNCICVLVRKDGAIVLTHAFFLDLATMTFTRKEFHEHSAQLDADQAQKEEEPTRNNKYITVFGIVKSSYYPPEDRSERYGNYPSSSNYNPTLLCKTTSPLDYVWILDIEQMEVKKLTIQGVAPRGTVNLDRVCTNGATEFIVPRYRLAQLLVCNPSKNLYQRPTVRGDIPRPIYDGKGFTVEDKLFFWDGKEFYEVDRVNSDEYVSTKYSMWTVFPDLSLIAPFALKDYPSYIFILCTPRKPKRTICYQLNIDTKELKVLEWRDGSVHHFPEFSIVATGPSYVVISYKDIEGNATLCTIHPALGMSSLCDICLTRIRLNRSLFPDLTSLPQSLQQRI